MRLLFDDRLQPITSQFGFLEAEAGVALDGFLAWQRPIHEPLGAKLKVSNLAGNLEQRLRRLLPLTMPSRRELFIPTRSRWTAYFANGRLGGDAFGPMSYLARKLGCRGVRVVATPSQRSPLRYGASMFELYGPNETQWLNTIRSINCLNDGGRWTFQTLGEPLPFEDTSTYELKRVRDRFPFEALDLCLRGLGIEAFIEQFYLEGGALVEKIGGPTANNPTYPLPSDESKG